MRAKHEGKGRSKWWIIVGVAGLIVMGLFIQEWQSSQVVGHGSYRFNLAIVGKEQGVNFVSFDPADKSILGLGFPPDLAIRSRTSGEYSVSTLYKLGGYSGQGGEFARRKVQGFMRVPVPGYIVVEQTQASVLRNLKRALIQVIWGGSETSLSRLDGLALYLRTSRYTYRDIAEIELVRAGVIVDNTYHPDRLQEYVGTRLFDWGIGASRPTVAIVNASGENGLGSDLADFLSNLGLDVVMVRSASTSEYSDKTTWQASSIEEAKEMSYIFQNLFGFPDPEIEEIPGEYRAKVLIIVGSDAKELF